MSWGARGSALANTRTPQDVDRQGTGVSPLRQVRRIYRLIYKITKLYSKGDFVNPFEI